MKKLIGMFFALLGTICSSNGMEQQYSYTYSKGDDGSKLTIPLSQKEAYKRMLQERITTIYKIDFQTHFQGSIVLFPEEADTKNRILKTWIKRFSAVVKKLDQYKTKTIEPINVLPYNLPWLGIHNNIQYINVVNESKKKNIYLTNVSKSITTLYNKIRAVKDTTENAQEKKYFKRKLLDLKIYNSAIDNILHKNTVIQNELERVFTRKTDPFIRCNFLNQFLKLLLGPGTAKQVVYTLSLGAIMEFLLLKLDFSKRTSIITIAPSATCFALALMNLLTTNYYIPSGVEKNG